MKDSRKPFLALLLLVLFLVIVARYTRDRDIFRESRSPVPRTKVSAKKASALYSQAVQIPARIQFESKVPDPYPRVCAPSFVDLARHSLNEILERPDILRAVMDPDCLSQGSLQGGAEVAQACAGNLEIEEKKLKCGAALIFWRVQAIHLSTLYEEPMSLSSAVLMNKIMAQFLGASAEAMKTGELRQMTELLIDKEPDLYAARKALVVVDVLEAMKKDGIVNEKFQEHIDNAKKLNGTDEELFEASLMPGMGKEDHYTEGKSRIENFSQENPGSDIALYYSAYVAWHEGRIDKAQSLVEQAIKKKPDENRYRETLKEMRSPDEKKEIFSSRLGVSFKDI